MFDIIKNLFNKKIDEPKRIVAEVSKVEIICPSPKLGKFNKRLADTDLDEQKYILSSLEPQVTIMSVDTKDIHNDVLPGIRMSLSEAEVFTRKVDNDHLIRRSHAYVPPINVKLAIVYMENEDIKVLECKLELGGEVKDRGLMEKLKGLQANSEENFKLSTSSEKKTQLGMEELRNDCIPYLEKHLTISNAARNLQMCRPNENWQEPLSNARYRLNYSHSKEYTLYDALEVDHTIDMRKSIQTKPQIDPEKDFDGSEIWERAYFEKEVCRNEAFHKEVVKELLYRKEFEMEERDAGRRNFTATIQEEKLINYQLELDKKIYADKVVKAEITNSKKDIEILKPENSKKAVNNIQNAPVAAFLNKIDKQKKAIGLER